MPNELNIIDKLQKAALSSTKIKNIKRVLHRISSHPTSTKIIFIFGCQRSGTTILSKIIDNSPFVKGYGEGDLPYFHPETGSMKLRLQSVNTIKALLKKEKDTYITLKPLYESQNASSLLNALKDSRSIWIFRNYFDVIDSHLKYYKVSGNDYIKDIFATNKMNWLNENNSEYIKDLITRFNNRTLNSASSFAMIWLIRNSLFFDCQPADKKILINYEKLVTKPALEIKTIFSFLSIDYKTSFSLLVHENSVAKKISFELDEDLLSECQKMYARLQNACEKIAVK